MSSDPTPEEEHLQDLYNEIRSLLEGRGIMSEDEANFRSYDDNELEDILRDFNQNKTSEH